MKMYVNGQWTESPNMAPLIAPYTGEVVENVPVATDDQIQQALAAAVKAAVAMAKLAPYERYQILMKAADLVAANVEDLAHAVSLGIGQPLSEARGEAGRIAELLRLSAFEGSQMRGEYLPIEANAGTKGKNGFTMRVPCGIFGGDNPFNYPPLLVVHKIGPALPT